MNKYFREVITYKSLDFKLSGCPGVFLEPKESQEETKNVCTLITEDLSDRFDQVTNLLSISKREFLRLALETAIDEAATLISDIDVFEYETLATLDPSGMISLSSYEGEIFSNMTDKEKSEFIQSKLEARK